MPRAPGRRNRCIRTCRVARCWRRVWASRGAPCCPLRRRAGGSPAAPEPAAPVSGAIDLMWSNEQTTLDFLSADWIPGFKRREPAQRGHPDRRARQLGRPVPEDPGHQRGRDAAGAGPREGLLHRGHGPDGADRAPRPLAQGPEGRLARAVPPGHLGQRDLQGQPDRPAPVLFRAPAVLQRGPVPRGRTDPGHPAGGGRHLAGLGPHGPPADAAEQGHLGHPALQLRRRGRHHGLGQLPAPGRGAADQRRAHEVHLQQSGGDRVVAVPGRPHRQGPGQPGPQRQQPGRGAEGRHVERGGQRRLQQLPHHHARIWSTP